MNTTAILPVKSFSAAKQRLRAELDPKGREALVEAMFADVLEALTRSSVDDVLVVTASPTAREIASGYGIRVVKDREMGHNAAAALGIKTAVAGGAERVLLVPGDCPALDHEELDGLLDRPIAPPSALIVPDRHGTGTNALLLTPPGALTPSFGPGSCQRHLALARDRGTNGEVVELPSLALDIDTPEDLYALASQAGRTLRTRQLLTRC